MIADNYPCHKCRRRTVKGQRKARIVAHGAGFVTKRLFCDECAPGLGTQLLEAICNWPGCTELAKRASTSSPALGIAFCLFHDEMYCTCPHLARQVDLRLFGK